MKTIPLAFSSLVVCSAALAAPIGAPDGLGDAAPPSLQLSGVIAPAILSSEDSLDLRDLAVARGAADFADDRAAPDYLFPRKGKSIVTLATGIPYLAIGEYAYGFTNRLSVGVVAGVLGNSLPGYGLRLRYILAQPSEDFRIHLKAPVIFYPKGKTLGCPDCEAWFLAWPSINAEWRLGNGTRLWTGAGIVAAACKTTVLGGREEKERMAEGFHEGVWNTFQLGFSRPVTSRLSFQCEVAAVLKGTRLPRTWAGGPPVILTTGFSHSF